MIQTLAWAKEHKLLGHYARQGNICYEQYWNRGATFENDRTNLMQDFEFHSRKTTASQRRPELFLESK